MPVAGAASRIVLGMEKPLRYGMSIVIDAPFTDAVAATRIALADAGFSVVMEMNVQAILDRKLGAELAPQIIFGVCNPSLAYRALTADPDIGVFVPSHVVVRADGDWRSVITAIDPLMMTTLAGSRADLRIVALEARSRLQRVLIAIDEAAGHTGRVLHAIPADARPSAGGGR